MLPLEKKRKKTEAKKSTNLVKWVRENIKTSGLIEIKVAKQLKNTECVYATQFENHQIHNLLSNQYTQKLPDYGGRNCADIITFYNPTNYIILCYTHFNILIHSAVYPFNQVKVTSEEALEIGTII